MQPKSRQGHLFERIRYLSGQIVGHVAVWGNQLWTCVSSTTCLSARGSRNCTTWAGAARGACAAEGQTGVSRSAGDSEGNREKTEHSCIVLQVHTTDLGAAGRTCFQQKPFEGRPSKTSKDSLGRLLASLTEASGLSFRKHCLLWVCWVGVNMTGRAVAQRCSFVRLCALSRSRQTRLASRKWFFL